MGDSTSSPSFRRELAAHVPAAILRNVCCFILSDEHPIDSPFDVVVCTTSGEVLELYRRHVRASVLLEDGLAPRDIAIYRNSENARFYLVSTPKKLYVVLAKDNLILYKLFDHVDRFEVSDPYCKGSACLRLWCNEDAVPVTWDDNVELGPDKETTFAEDEDCSTFVSSLKSKLTEARHTVALNEKRYDSLLKFRQTSMHTILEDMCPNAINSAFKSCEKVHESMSVENSTPWLKLTNSKVVFCVTICNNTDSITFSNIRLILKSNIDSPISYHTHIYTERSTAPFWQRKYSTVLAPKARANIVAVTDIEEFAVDNRIDYFGVLAYEMEGREKFIPLQIKSLSCLDTLNLNFDLLSTKTLERTDYLGILSTTMSFKLEVYQVDCGPDERVADLMSLLQSHMSMEQATDTEHVLIHRTSPYHVLNGVMIVFDDLEMVENGVVNKITLYLRNTKQLSSVLHLIYDTVPHRLLVTVPEVTIRDKRDSKTISKKQETVIEDFMDIDDILKTPEECGRANLIDFGNSLSIQMGLVLKHLDECMISMGSSKNSEDVVLVGTKIDVNASGASKYLEFCYKLSEEIRRGNMLLDFI